MNKQTTRVLQNHSERSHALLSASGASRWLNCTPSARLEEQFGQKKTSAYAEEGTLAHEISELFLRHDLLKTVDDTEFDAKLEELMAKEFFSDEMLDYVSIYTDYCSTEYNAAITENPFAEAEVESKLDMTEYIPDGFGTADFVLINDDVMEVIDLKYGKGVPVYANNNKQLMLYGLGALRKYDTMYDITQIKLTIVQPRINNISTWMISVEDLIKWAIEVLKPAAELAYLGKGEQNPGEWCKFCSVKSTCRALADKHMQIAKYEFKKPELLTDDEIVEILKVSPDLIEWANSVVEYAEKQAFENGTIYDGYKLVEGTSRRKWADEDQVTNAIFARLPELSEDQIFDTKLKSITQIEKLVGKARFTETLGDVVIKPKGKPTLVPITDKRPALGIEEAINDFK